MANIKQVLARSLFLFVFANCDENSLLLKKQSLQLETHCPEAFRTTQEQSKIYILRELCTIFKSGSPGTSAFWRCIKYEETTKYMLVDTSMLNTFLKETYRDLR